MFNNPFTVVITFILQYSPNNLWKGTVYAHSGPGLIAATATSK